MKIYCIHDKLINFYMQPFAAPDDKHVLSSIASLINNGDTRDAIAQAPHHFEIYCLGYVTDDGHIVAEKEFLGDCASLIRRDIRGEPISRTAGRGESASTGQGTPRAPEGDADPAAEVTRSKTPSTYLQP